MFEIEIMNKKTKETEVIIGYSFKEACKSAGLDATEWTIIGSWYID